MVRLKFESNSNSVFTTKFQFLNGAIKMEMRKQGLLFLATFQFLNGAIKIVLQIFGEQQEVHFNSSMVRLKLTSFIEGNGFAEFQFLNGAIKIFYLLD